LTNELKFIYLIEILTVLLNLFLIKNGLGNRPDDAVATALILRGQVLNPAPQFAGKDERKINF
jgi:hypothetical protein